MCTSKGMQLFYCLLEYMICSFSVIHKKQVFGCSRVGWCSAKDGPLRGVLCTGILEIPNAFRNSTELFPFGISRRQQRVYHKVSIFGRALSYSAAKKNAASYTSQKNYISYTPTSSKRAEFILKCRHNKFRLRYAN